MKKSITTKYFVLLCSVIIACVICIGSVLLLTLSEFYKREKKDMLFNSLDSIVNVTELSYAPEGKINAGYLSAKYYTYASAQDMEFLLINSDGNIIVTSNMQNSKITYDLKDTPLTDEDGMPRYFEIVNIPNQEFKSSYLAGTSFKLGEDTFYLYAVKSAEELNMLMLRLIKVFFIVTLIIIAVVFTVVYFMTKTLMKPIKEMTDAAERFGRGEFDKKIEIKDDNEIGILAASLNDMAYSLSKIEETRRNFIANVSHELKTPMTSIGGFIDGILDGTIQKEQQNHYLKIVSQEVYRLARLVRSMLNISKYETGEMELNTETFNVTDLTAKTAFLFEARIESKELEVIGLESEAFYVKADVDLVQQVIYNLVENAVKFVDQGGYISFRFEYNEDDRKTYIYIRNSGEGLTEDELPKVFDRFYKTDESHGKDKTGVGLGLSIVRSIIKLHGGKISVRSVVGEYTEFSFSLPAGKNPYEKNN